MMLRYTYLLIFVIGATSCVTKKKLTYLRKSSIPQQPMPLRQYAIRPGDNLHIQIKSGDPSTSSFYNLSNDNASGPYNEAYTFLNSYIVDDKGVILLPSLGKIHVSGLTIQEIVLAIKNELADHLVEAGVFVRLTSYKVTILGEVYKPGTYNIYQSNPITIFEALGLAGDATNYGLKKRVKVVRMQNDRPYSFEIDLTSKESFSSEIFMVYPHDVILVEPMRIRAVEMNLKPIGVVLSAAAVVLLILRTFTN